jgi:hypothetical protein
MSLFSGSIVFPYHSRPSNGMPHHIVLGEDGYVKI